MNKQKDYLKKIHAETKKIEIDKWYEGLRTHNDPGEKYIYSWIDEHGEEFHIKWLNCKCRTCTKSDICGYSEVEQCDKYNEDKE